MNYKLTIAFLFACSLSPLLTKGQYVSRNGNFKIDEIKGCAPMTVQVTPVTACAPCDINYQFTNLTGTCAQAFAPSETIVQNVFTSPSYTTPGKYKLTILFPGGICDDVTIDILPNIKPNFELYYCSGNQVSVKVTDTNYPSPNEYKINYNDLSTEDAVASGGSKNHTFTSAGIKTINVRGVLTNAKDNCFSSQDTIKIRTVSAPKITQLEVINSSQIKLNFTTQNHVLYKLDIASNNNTSFQQLKTVYNKSADTISSLNPDNSFYCFRMGINNPCANTTTYAVDKICSANFDVVAKNNQNDLTWVTSSAGLTNYTINRNGAGLPPNPAASAASQVDINIICNTDYTYQLISNYTNGAFSISLPKTVTSFSSDVSPVIDNITSVVHANGTGVDLSWPPGLLPKEYTIYNATVSVGKVTTEAFTDDNYSNGNFCYRIKYENTCGNSNALGVEACPIQLSGRLQKDNTIILTWSDYGGWLNGVSSYTVEKYTLDGQLLQTYNIAGTTTFTDDVQDLSNQGYIYIVKADANDAGLGQAVSNTIKIIKQPNIFYPAAFTPNSDGLNDQFVVFGQFVSTFEMKIFNRWGEMMFSTNTLNSGWDGNYKGLAMPEGTYAFVATITDSSGKTFNRSGSVVLLRKK